MRSHVTKSDTENAEAENLAALRQQVADARLQTANDASIYSDVEKEDDFSAKYNDVTASDNTRHKRNMRKSVIKLFNDIFNKVGMRRKIEK